MIGAQKHKALSTKEIPTIKLVNCPDCGKKRFGRYTNEDGVATPASDETVEVRGKTRYLEVCGFCVAKYQAEDEKFAKENLRKLAKAIKINNIPDGNSDHNDFSLN